MPRDMDPILFVPWVLGYLMETAWQRQQNPAMVDAALRDYNSRTFAAWYKPEELGTVSRLPQISANYSLCV